MMPTRITHKNSLEVAYAKKEKAKKYLEILITKQMIIILFVKLILLSFERLVFRNMLAVYKPFA